jgi:putative ABC transport system permease protein
MSQYGLTYDDAHRISALFPMVEVQVPSRVIPTTMRVGNARLPATIVGTVPWYLKNSGFQLLEGRFICDEDVRSTANVCVLTPSAVSALFPLSWPIGETVYLDQSVYVVVGVAERTAAVDGNGIGAISPQDVYTVMIPISAAQKRFGEVTIRRESGSFSAERVELHELTVSASSEEAVVPLSEAIRTMLHHFHKESDFDITVPLELLKQAEATKRIFTIVLGSIAAISLLVGGIGIMNIMLASVTERTREIGIRRALGATQADIVLQFLAEALILSLAGGLIGIAIGVTGPKLVTHFADMPTIITTYSLALAFVISVLTGLVFGIYPAYRASQMSPIEALRHE